MPSRPDAPTPEDAAPEDATASAPADTAAGPALWQALGWQPTQQQQQQFSALQEQLRLWNGRLNLTRLVEGEDFWIAQVFDSLWPFLPLLEAEAVAATDASPLELIDVGTGGGFPGLAVAIALPRARLTLVDSVGRKVEAVRAMATTLGLGERVNLRCERIEKTGQAAACRGRFDWAMARAVASAPVVAEYLVPLLRPSGQALLYRGQWSNDDQAALDRALVPLRARCALSQARDLPAGRGIRHALILTPTGPCPRTYPRAVGLPSKQPLGTAIAR
ncbi:16S rRNA (guanine(527)-N(7))-methyltransferase RsmG [Synechococcus sp. CBW1002]|uniref:16S rRNA (guanine(527)-N(7))-methyltransferase RsmG n=1 Tax=Synechococcus sp. CBW1002 TaxID=1353134 RepID=UPI0018CE115E|nr:16S rRNA (guanine(527)-N(7))-methyltransferase RsmG [Synechococcus sp. CBW1002]QPN60145.1 16S rRNA (guanine(527)-N(7))-methyltransferase RsmG [Synechococcus sp. CBW1002]